MPLYDYQCRTCKTVTEVRHGFGEVHEGLCPACEGELARVFTPAGIVFKGSGFYLTDSRKSSQAGVSGSSTAAASTSEASTPATTPAAAPAATSGGDAPKKSETAA